MHLPMRQRPDATALSERARCPADLSARDLPDHGAVHCADRAALDPADRNQLVPSGQNLRSVRKLPMARGLPVIRSAGVALILLCALRPACAEPTLNEALAALRGPNEAAKLYAEGLIVGAESGASWANAQ